VVLVDQVKEPLQEMITLFLGYAVDMTYMASDWEDALPTSHGIGADDRMDCLEVESDVLWRTTGLAVELEPTFLGDLFEVWLGEGPGQPFQELLVWLADAIVNLIARSPESVCSTSASQPYLGIQMGRKPRSGKAWSHSPPPVSGSSTRRSEV
jgi:hypothetical protein